MVVTGDRTISHHPLPSLFLIASPRPMFEAFVHKIFWPYLLGGLVALMSISNPLSKIPLFVGLTEDMSDAERAAVAVALRRYPPGEDPRLEEPVREAVLGGEPGKAVHLGLEPRQVARELGADGGPVERVRDHLGEPEPLAQRHRLVVPA